MGGPVPTCMFLTETMQGAGSCLCTLRQQGDQ